MISKFLKAALAGQDITIYGDGSQTRTFCYIDDNIETCAKIFQEHLHINDVVNIGSDIEVTILELAKMIIELTESKSKIIHLPPLPEGDMTRRQPDISKMKIILNRDQISLQTGIRKILENRRTI